MVLRSGLQGGKQTVGTVIYYGMPVKDGRRTQNAQRGCIGDCLQQRHGSPKKSLKNFIANMKTAGKSLEYKIFNGVHGFANPSNPKYDEALGKKRSLWDVPGLFEEEV